MEPLDAAGMVFWSRSGKGRVKGGYCFMHPGRPLVVSSIGCLGCGPGKSSLLADEVVESLEQPYREVLWDLLHEHPPSLAVLNGLSTEDDNDRLPAPYIRAMGKMHEANGS